MIRCLHCGAETSNGLALCDLSMTKAAACLELLPVYFRNLARWSPGRAGTRTAPGSRAPNVAALGDNRISRALDEAGTDIQTWVQCLVDDRGVRIPDSDTEATVVTAACRALAENLTSIATLEWAGEFVRKIGRHESRLRSLTETAAPGWYAGGCHMCHAPTYVVPGLTWVTCRSCGVTTYARDHLDTILTEAGDWIAPPMRLAEAVVALVDTEFSITRLHKRISKWGERERVATYRKLDHDGDPCGPKRHRLGDVLTLLQLEGATRLDDEGARDAATAG